MASAIGSLPQRPETAEKSRPVPENSEANGGWGCSAQDPDVESHGTDPVRLAVVGMRSDEYGGLERYFYILLF